MSLIGNPSCGAPCNTGCVCTELLSSTCIFYPGETLPNTGISTNNSITEALIKIDQAIGSGTNVPVSSTDNCEGALNDKIRVGEGLTKTVVVEDGCQKLLLTSSGGSCENCIQSVVGGTDISVDNSDPQNLIVNYTGGGGSPMYFEVTKTELDSLVSSDGLIPDALYKISYVNAKHDIVFNGIPFTVEAIYENGVQEGISVYLKAISTNELEQTGHGEFFNAKIYDYNTEEFIPQWTPAIKVLINNLTDVNWQLYEAVTSDFGDTGILITLPTHNHSYVVLQRVSGAWDNFTTVTGDVSGESFDVSTVDIYAVDSLGNNTFLVSPSDKVYYGGYVWENTTGEYGTMLDHVTLSGDWSKIPWSDTNFYERKIDIITYDYEYDLVTSRKDITTSNSWEGSINTMAVWNTIDIHIGHPTSIVNGITAMNWIGVMDLSNDIITNVVMEVKDSLFYNVNSFYGHVRQSDVSISNCHLMPFAVSEELASTSIFYCRIGNDDWNVGLISPPLFEDVQRNYLKNCLFDCVKYTNLNLDTTNIELFNIRSSYFDLLLVGVDNQVKDFIIEDCIMDRINLDLSDINVFRVEDSTLIDVNFMNCFMTGTNLWNIDCSNVNFDNVRQIQLASDISNGFITIQNTTFTNVQEIVGNSVVYLIEDSFFTNVKTFETSNSAISALYEDINLSSDTNDINRLSLEVSCTCTAPIVKLHGNLNITNDLSSSTDIYNLADKRTYYDTTLAQQSIVYVDNGVMTVVDYNN